jgi:hypothetical protein
VQFGFRVSHHDHDYVESRGGWELYTHLRAGGKRSTFRRHSLTRATGLYRLAWARDGGDFERCGLALLVLQRAALAVEDLGGVLHALAEETDHWKRLTSTRIPELDSVFSEARQDLGLSGPARDCPTIAPFCLGTAEQIEGEPGWSPAQSGAANALADLWAERWRKQICPVVDFWEKHRSAAKSTMHGYPIIAGRHMLGPPPAGPMAEHIPDPGVPFAVVLSTSQKAAGGLRTELTRVRCDPPTVEAMNRAGRAAADLYRDLCLQQARSIGAGCAVMIPTSMLERLSPSQQTAMREKIDK